MHLNISTIQAMELPDEGWKENELAIMSNISETSIHRGHLCMNMIGLSFFVLELDR